MNPYKCYQPIRQRLLDKLVEEAKAQPTAMHNITLPKDITNEEKKYLVSKGLSLSTDRMCNPIATYPQRMRAEDLKNKVLNKKGK